MRGSKRPIVDTSQLPKSLPKRIRKPVGRFSSEPAPMPSSDSSENESGSDNSPPPVRRASRSAVNSSDKGKRSNGSASTSRSKRPQKPTTPTQVKHTRPKSSSAAGGALLPLSRFRLNGNLLFTDSIHQQRFTNLEQRDIVPCKIFNAEFLKELGVYETILGYMTNIGWAKLLDYDYPVYIELTREFYATFELSKRNDFTLDTPDMVRFRMLGTMYEMSYIELNAALGLFQADLSDAPDLDALYGDFSHEFKGDRYDFWCDLVNDQNAVYDPRSSRASGIVDSSLRIIHKWMAFSVSARPNSAHIVSMMELFFLWCIKRNVKADFARWLAREFDDVAQSQDKRVKRSLSLGVYITRIAVHKGLIDVKKTNLHVACANEQVDQAFLKACRILKESEGNLEFVTPGVTKGADPSASGAVASHVHEFLDDLDREEEQSRRNAWDKKLDDIIHSQALILDELAKIKQEQARIVKLLEPKNPPSPSPHSSSPNTT